MWLYKSPVKIFGKVLEGHITPGILDRFGSTISSMTALANANMLRLFPFLRSVRRMSAGDVDKRLYTSPVM